MPELPEVETILRSLQPKALGHVIRKVTVIHEKTIKMPDPELFASSLQGQKITGFNRWGKYLIMEIGSSIVLVIHLRMTGRLIFSEAGIPVNKYTRVIFYLDQGMEIHFQDIHNLLPCRRTGFYHLPCNEICINNLPAEFHNHCTHKAFSSGNAAC
jgi:formamidopyrimidine-DNA glycosylase